MTKYVPPMVETNVVEPTLTPTSVETTPTAAKTPAAAEKARPCVVTIGEASETGS